MPTSIEQYAADLEVALGGAREALRAGASPEAVCAAAAPLDALLAELPAVIAKMQALAGRISAAVLGAQEAGGHLVRVGAVRAAPAPDALPRI